MKIWVRVSKAEHFHDIRLNLGRKLKCKVPEGWGQFYFRQALGCSHCHIQVIIQDTRSGQFSIPATADTSSLALNIIVPPVFCRCQERSSWVEGNQEKLFAKNSKQKMPAWWSWAAVAAMPSAAPSWVVSVTMCYTTPMYRSSFAPGPTTTSGWSAGLFGTVRCFVDLVCR